MRFLFDFPILLFIFTCLLSSSEVFASSTVTKEYSQQELHDLIKSKLEAARTNHSEVAVYVLRYVEKYSQSPKDLDLLILRTDLIPVLEFDKTNLLLRFFESILKNHTLSAPILVNFLLQIEWILWIQLRWSMFGSEKAKLNFAYWINLKTHTLARYKKSYPLIYVMFSRFFSIDLISTYDNLLKSTSQGGIIEDSLVDRYDPQDAFIALRRFVQDSNESDSKSIPCSFSLLSQIFATNLKYYLNEKDNASYLFTLHQFVKTGSFNGFDISNYHIFVDLLGPDRGKTIDHLYLAFGSKLSKCFSRFFHSNPIYSLTDYDKNHSNFDLLKTFDYTFYTKVFCLLPNETLKVAFLRTFAQVYFFDKKSDSILSNSGFRRSFTSFFSSKGENLLLEKSAREIVHFYLDLLWSNDTKSAPELRTWLFFLHKLLVDRTLDPNSNKGKNRALFHKVFWKEFGKLGGFLSTCLSSSDMIFTIGDFEVVDLNLNDYRENDKNDPAYMDPKKLDRRLLNMDSVFFFSNKVYQANSNEFSFYHIFNNPAIFDISPIDSYDTMLKSPFITPSQLPANEDPKEYYEKLFLPEFHPKTNPYQSYADFISQHYRQYLLLLILNVGIIQHDRDMRSLMDSTKGKDTLAASSHKEFVASLSSLGSSGDASLGEKLSKIISILDSSIHLTKFQSLATSFLGMLINREEVQCPQSRKLAFYNLILDFMIALVRGKKLPLNGVLKSIRDIQLKFPFTIRSHRCELYSSDEFFHFDIKFSQYNFLLNELVPSEHLGPFSLIRDFIAKDDFRPDSNFQTHSLGSSDIYKVIDELCRDRVAFDSIIRGEFKGLEASLLSPYAFLLTPNERGQFSPHHNFVRPFSFAVKDLNLSITPNDHLNPFEFACYHSGKVLSGFAANQVKNDSDILLIASLLNLLDSSTTIYPAFSDYDNFQVSSIRAVSKVILGNHLPDLNGVLAEGACSTDKVLLLKRLHLGPHADQISVPTTEDEAKSQLSAFFISDSNPEAPERNENDSDYLEDTIEYSSPDELSQEDGHIPKLGVQEAISKAFGEDLFIQFPLNMTSSLYSFLEDLVHEGEILSSQALLSNALLQLEWRLFVVSLYYSFLYTDNQDFYKTLLFEGVKLKKLILSKVKSELLANFFGHFMSKFTCEVFEKISPGNSSQFSAIHPYDADSIWELLKKFSLPQHSEVILFSEKLVSLILASNLPYFTDEPFAPTDYNYIVTTFLTRTFQVELDTSLEYIYGYFYYKKYYRFINEFILIKGLDGLEYYYALTKKKDPSRIDLLGSLYVWTPGALAKRYLISSYFKDLNFKRLNYERDQKILKKEVVSFLNPERSDLNIVADLERDVLIFRNKLVSFSDIARTYIYLVQKIANFCSDDDNTVFLYLNNFLSCPQADEVLEKARLVIWNSIITNYSYFGVFLHQWSPYLGDFSPVDAFHFSLVEEWEEGDPIPDSISLSRSCVHQLAALIVKGHGNSIVKPILHLIDPFLILEVDGHESIRVVKNLLVSTSPKNAEAADEEKLLRSFLSKRIKDRISTLKLDFSDAISHLCKHFVQSIVFEYIVLLERRHLMHTRKKLSGHMSSWEAYENALTYSEIPRDLKLRKFSEKFNEDFLDYNCWLSPNNIQLNKSHSQALYTRSLKLDHFLPSSYQSEFSDFELASLISYKLIKNLTKEAAYPFDPRFIHLLFFSNLTPPTFDEDNIIRSRKLVLGVVSSIVPEIIEMSSIALENEKETRVQAADWGRRWKFLCLTCPILYNFENLYLEEFEAKSLYLKHTTVEDAEDTPSPQTISSEETPSGDDEVGDSPRKVAAPLAKPKKKNNNKKNRKKRQDYSPLILYRNKRKGKGKRKPARKDNSGEKILDNSTRSSSSNSSSPKSESSGNYKDSFHLEKPSLPPTFNRNVDKFIECPNFLLRPLYHTSAKVTPPIIKKFVEFSKNPQEEFADISEFLTRSVKSHGDLFTEGRIFRSSESLIYFVDNFADKIKWVSIDYELTGAKIQSSEKNGIEYLRQVVRTYDIVEVGLTLFLKDGSHLVFSIYTGPNRDLNFSPASYNFLSEHSFNYDEYLRTRVDEIFLIGIFNKFGDHSIPIIFHNGGLDALFTIKLIRPELILSSEAPFTSIEDVELVFKNELRLCIFDTKFIFMSNFMIWNTYLKLLHNSEDYPNLGFQDLKTFCSLFLKIPLHFFKYFPLHSAGADSYFTMRLFEAYMASNQVNVLQECEGFINSEYRRFIKSS